ncbi:uncharacterized protein CC84DRAFT_861659 [Paraphaeosphaeria sporulosa]|uniref:Uncharacterized protein n=1 Tax=Paraphaeosphaeria sporulosa TaxID=1460663 RepID=A0A177C7L8_9PLEO|nr:uncharacterized protein CC84DRAFT_861659 [Paraphaeosphaeria sporulosa]OAG03643.1 hypothetical protein CC84DRAFT_861659 [Paraphaeosphaeria sporulosa]
MRRTRTAASNRLLLLDWCFAQGIDRHPRKRTFRCCIFVPPSQLPLPSYGQRSGRQSRLIYQKYIMYRSSARTFTPILLHRSRLHVEHSRLLSSFVRRPCIRNPCDLVSHLA